MRDEDDLTRRVTFFSLFLSLTFGRIVETSQKNIRPFPIPDSRFPIPDSRFPIPDSRLPKFPSETGEVEQRPPAAPEAAQVLAVECCGAG